MSRVVLTIVLFVLAGLVAVADWWSVAERRRQYEHVLKPLTLALIITATATADLGPATWWILAGLVLGLLGDVGLMLSDETAELPDLPFLLGLGSFLLGHVCYMIGFVRHGLHGWQLLAGALVVVGITALPLLPVLRSARRVGGTGLMATVGGYALALGAMAVLAAGTGAIATAVGGVLFVVSDTLIATDKFVRSHRVGFASVPSHGWKSTPVQIIVTYHLAQLLIPLGLIAW